MVSNFFHTIFFPFFMKRYQFWYQITIKYLWNSIKLILQKCMKFVWLAIFHRLSVWNCMISIFGLWRSTRGVCRGRIAEGKGSVRPLPKSAGGYLDGYWIPLQERWSSKKNWFCRTFCVCCADITVISIFFLNVVFRVMLTIFQFYEQIFWKEQLAEVVSFMLIRQIKDSHDNRDQP